MAISKAVAIADRVTRMEASVVAVQALACLVNRDMMKNQLLVNVDHTYDALLAKSLKMHTDQTYTYTTSL